MPEKYISSCPQAEEQRRRAMSSSRRNLWRKPEPPPPPKPRQYFVLGVEVDYETYRKYNYERSYRIDGDYVKDILCSIGTLERYATEEHAKEYPVEAANASKILEQIVKEITPKGDNEVSMKKSRDFITELSGIYAESRKAHEAVKENLDKAESAINTYRAELDDPNCKNRTLADARFVAAKEEYTEAQFAARKEMEDIRRSFAKKAQELRDQFSTYLEDHYAVSPDKLDTATMQLLNSGICSPAELARLAERHKGNPTMLRMIGVSAKSIAEDPKQSRENCILCRKVAAAAAAAKDGSRELNIYDSAVSAAERGLQSNIEVANKMDGFMGEWFSTFSGEIDALPNAPTEIVVDG